MTILNGRLRFYIEGYDGSVDPAQQGWVVGVSGEVDTPPTPSIAAASMIPQRLPSKGGLVTVSVAVENSVALESIRAEASFKKKKITTNLEKISTEGTVSNYQGVLQFPKNRKKKTQKYLVSVIGTTTAEEEFSEVVGKNIKVKKKRPKKRK
jgi:hypothetical protein